MYWSLEAALKELKQRQEDSELRRKADEFLGSSCPIPTSLEPQGFLARHLPTARLEDIQFEQRCRDVGLVSLFLTYNDDVFFTNNPSKMRLIRLFVLEGYGKNGGPRLQKVFLVEREKIETLNGIPLSSIETKWGESLLHFHQRAREKVGIEGKVVDLSDWLKSIGRAREYYKYLLAACLTKGILFESFESPGFPNLETFSQLVVLPAWRWISSEFGCPPLIVRHPDTSLPEEEERILNWYPQNVLEVIPK